MAAVIDLCTRMAVGLAFPGRMTADLPIAALGAISRSDRGSQHAPEAGDGRLGARRTAHDVRLPAGETGPRHDNAVAESFLGTFKN